ncbi:MAG: PKD domain-containing protein, partial [Methanoregulaceae archaeon]|nr:PKD domain-containing protein [Methanoregulaceae archaeon]
GGDRINEWSFPVDTAGYAPGMYSIAVSGITVDARAGGQFIVRGDQDPSAEFSQFPVSGTSPLYVQFTGASSGTPPLDYRWNFGDGSPNSSLENPVHIFNSTVNQTYTITLTVSNGIGSDTVKRAVAVFASGETQGTARISLEPGWNFISVPDRLVPGNDTAAAVFGDVDSGGHSLFAFSAMNHTWHQLVPDDEVMPLYGIWVYSTVRKQVPLVFDSNLSSPPLSVNLFQGWNAIGTPSRNQGSAHELLLPVAGQWTTLIGFDPVAQRYEPSIIRNGSGIHTDSNPMYPMKGYWLFMNAPGELTASAP